MIPLQDMSPVRRRPTIVCLLIIINVLVFAWEVRIPQGRQLYTLYKIAVVPSLFRADPFSLESFLDVLRTTFLHGNFLHLAGNMLVLFVFGDNLEERLGKLGFFGLYLISGYIAIVAEVLIGTHPSSPLIGASGAIAGVLGAFFILFPRTKIITLIPIFFCSSNYCLTRFCGSDRMVFVAIHFYY